MRFKNNILILIILLIAVILRFWNYSEIPFTNDEFSALFRTHYGSFSELINKGVLIDGHPAGTQIFIYYWVKVFGYSEICVKFPFIIFGILSILVLYKIAKLWYNDTVALICASFLASLQYAVMYSQIARPYISGLFFTLLLVYFLTKIILQKANKKYSNYIFFIISASLCTYNHHFSLLFAVIIGISGLFLMKRNQLLPYLLSGILIFVLYIPHLPIFFYQLKVGGVEGWLGKPNNDYLLVYLKYIFQYSIYIYLLVFGLIIFGLIHLKKNTNSFNKKYFIISLIWFLLPYLIGFFYSRYVSSVIQFSVLIFNFPFLLFVIFGHIKVQKVKINAVIVAIILTTNILVLVLQRKHFEIFYNSPQEQSIKEITKIKSNNKKTIILISDYNRKISLRYIKKYNIKSEIIWFDKFKNEGEFIHFLEHNKSKYDNIYFAGLSESNPLILPIITDYFPEMCWQKNYNGGTSYLFKKGKMKQYKMIDQLDFESNNKSKNWDSLTGQNYIDTLSFSGKKSYLIDSLSEWSLSFEKNLIEFANNKNDLIEISLKTYLLENLKDVILMVGLETKDSSFYCGGTPFEIFHAESKTSLGNYKWSTIHHTFKIKEEYLKNKDLKLKVFIWNKGKNNLIIDDFEIKLRKGNPILYGLFESF